VFCDGSNPADAAVSLANGATSFPRVTFNDWIQTLQWIRQDTPSNAVVIAWWDYGYWITVMGNRTTAADNATINSTRIALIGQMFMSNVTQAAKIAKEIGSTPGGGVRPVYVLMFITGSIIPSQLASDGNSHYILEVPSGSGWFTAGGGDESKKQWFIRIGGLQESQYLACLSSSSACLVEDDFNLTPMALNTTLFAKLLPFKSDGYLVPSVSSSTGGISFTAQKKYQDGTLGSSYVPPFESFAYPGAPTYPTNSSGPFRLAYESPSLINANPNTTPSGTACPGNSQLQCFNGIVVYKVN
jgi:dolichyl-diphosphooligosaccharide--protein glycosyltransferase